MFKIGENILVKGKVVLAPMAGVTFYSYRKFMAPFGVSMFYSEMVSDCGLIYENKETYKYLKTDKDEHPFGIQLFGSKAETICKAIDIIKECEHQPDFIDLNLACPVPKVTRPGSGSSLLKDVDYLKEMVSTIVKHSPYPITCKIRLGWDDKNINFLQIIGVLEEIGVKAIALHVRTAKQLYAGKARYDLVKDLREKMNIPLIISGDIYTLDDAINALEITKADAVMVARGGIGNPFLINQIDEYYKSGVRLENPSLENQKEWCIKLAEMMVNEYGEEKAFRVFRTIGPRFFNGYSNSKQIKTKITLGVSCLNELKYILSEYIG